MASPFLCEVCGTVPTGLEPGAANECQEVLGRAATVVRGRVSFQLACLEELTKVYHGLSSVRIHQPLLGILLDEGYWSSRKYIHLYRKYTRMPTCALACIYIDATELALNPMVSL